MLEGENIFHKGNARVFRREIYIQEIGFLILMSFPFISWFSGLIFRPKKTLKELHDQPLPFVFLYYLIVMGIFALLWDIVGLPFWPGDMSYLDIHIRWVQVPIIVCLGWLFYGIIAHLGVIVSGGKGGISQTLKAVMFCATPLAFIGWIPLLGLAGFFWGALLVGDGVKEYHQISPAGANFASYHLPFMVLMVIFILITLWGLHLI